MQAKHSKTLLIIECFQLPQNGNMLCLLVNESTLLDFRRECVNVLYNYSSLVVGIYCLFCDVCYCQNQNLVCILENGKFIFQRKS